MFTFREKKVNKVELESGNDWKLYKGKILLADTVLIDKEKYLKLLQNPKDIFSYPIEAFGINFPKNPVSYFDFYNKFLRKRVGEWLEEDLLIFLVDLGYHCKYFNPFEIVKMTNAKMICDEYWVDFGEGEIFFGLPANSKYDKSYYLNRKWLK